MSKVKVIVFIPLEPLGEVMTETPNVMTQT